MAKDDYTELNIKGADGQLNFDANLGKNVETINNKANSKGAATGKTLTIQSDHLKDQITINNLGNTDESKWQTKVVQGNKADLVLTINNGSEKAAAKWSGEITGGAGTLKINNAHANSEWTGVVTGGAGKVEITNSGTYKTGKVTGGDGAVSITNTGTFQSEVDTQKGDVTLTNNKTWETGAITHKGAGNLTINNNKDATLKSVISGNSAGTGEINIINNGTMDTTATITADNKTKRLNIQNGVSSTGAANPQADIKGTITAKENGALIINHAIISGAITAGNGEGDKGTTITNFSGSITGGIKAGTGDLTIENYAEISDNSKKIETVSGTKKLTINNHAGDIKAEIDAATQVATSVNITNDAGATISGAVKLKSADQKSATLTNHGSITNAIDAGGQNVTINNTGSITHANGVKFTGADSKVNTLNNSGHISKVETATANSILTLTNTGSGIIDVINAGSSTTINVASGYAVDISSDRTKADGGAWVYETDGAINVTGDGKVNFGTGSAGAAFRAAGNNGPAFIIADMDIGKQYDLSKFIAGNKTSTNMNTADQIAQNIGFTNSLYGASFDKNGIMTISVEANKSIGALGAIQSIANMNSQMTRAQSIIDGVFDAVATGEIGNLSYPREGAISAQYTGASKKSKLEELAEAVESEKDPKAKEEKLALLLAEKERANKSWIGFATPYFSTSSIAATGFAATNGSAMGFVGGAAKALDNGVLFGAHIGVESQNAGKVGAEMQSLGSSFMAGVHTKMPLGQVNKASLSLVPFVKLQANAMLAANSYRLTPLMDTTREATGLVSGFSASALFGLDMPTNFGFITPEIGLMQQAVIMPELTFNSFNTAANNQTIKGTTATPMYLLAQIRYTKAIKLEKISLFPTIKAGIRYAMAGNSFVSSINVQNGLFYATNNIDSFVGVLEAGLGAKLGQNTAINLSYGGEFGAQVKTHNINVRVGWQF
ncbi:hypothetical protein XJ32_04690 [Helicobacter bilis]|uniref:Autotransporter domain-containing protein n=1 Tax=Helicobacter bilis TaxID=37372 RepID=A0A1Q2LGE1_9HELI|nr:hypothetical protein [Helicobacter bilis]AQQ59506.1 hypothetical protein XJ32_04690 [Helicobacter bilis]